MEKNADMVRQTGRFLAIVITSILFGSTMILSAVGPVRASEVPVKACSHNPAALPYLA